jgi:hypothetical protein
MSEIKVGRGFIALGDYNGHPIVINVDNIRDVFVEEKETVAATFNNKGKVITPATKVLMTIIRFNSVEQNRWQLDANGYSPEKIFEAMTQAKLSPTEQLDARLQEKDL